MKAAIHWQILIALSGLLVVISLNSCAEISQKEYDTLKEDLIEAQINVSRLQTDLSGEQKTANDIRHKLEQRERQITEMIGELLIKDAENAGYKEKLDLQEAEIAKIERQLEKSKDTIAELEEELKVVLTQIPEYKLPANRTIDDCIEPMNIEVRQQALSIVSDVPSGINANSESWKIWSIFYWVSNNIVYISDPKGQEYLAYAHETLETKTGDCDDFSILLASMYESVGLDSVLAYIDTDDEPGINHVTCLVYWEDDGQSFLDDEKVILNKERITSPTGKVHIKYLDARKSQSILSKYDEGIWIVADATICDVRGMVGYVTHEPYKIDEVIDVGN